MEAALWECDGFDDAFHHTTFRWQWPQHALCSRSAVVVLGTRSGCPSRVTMAVWPDGGTGGKSASGDAVTTVAAISS